jgi:hypothetical protein
VVDRNIDCNHFPFVIERLNLLMVKACSIISVGFTNLVTIYQQIQGAMAV